MGFNKIYKRQLIGGGRCGSLMVRVLDSRLSGPGSGRGQGHCCVLGQDTLLSLSLSPGVSMGTGKNAGGNPAMD